MKTLTPQELATKVAKESTGVSVRQGRTNGKAVLHLIRRRNDERNVMAASVTILATQMDWHLHPWNDTNKPKEAENK